MVLEATMIWCALIVFFTFGTIMSLVYTVRDMFDDGGDSGGGPVR